MFTCKYCNREFESFFAANTHSQMCLLNPDSKIKKQNAAIAATKAVKEKAANDPLNEVKTYDLVCSKCGNSYQLDLRIRDYNNRKL